MRSANRDARRVERTTRRTSERALRDQQDRARQRLAATTQRVEDVDMRQHNAIVTGVLPRIQGAVDSWCRKRVRIHIQMDAPRFSAQTDFESIAIRIPEDAVSVDFLGDLRGLSYHEAGHIRKTVPYPRLIELVGKATGQEYRDIESAPAPITPKELQQAWNVLEDQRMETAMVVDSKNLGRYYNVIVLAHVIHNINPHSYAWLAAREHIDPDVVEAAREMMIACMGEPETERIEDCVWRYVETNDPVVMWASVVELAVFLKANGVPIIVMDEHSFEADFEDGEADDDQGILDGSATPRPSKSDQASKDEQDANPDMGGDEGDKSDDGDPGKGAGSSDGDDESDDTSNGAGTTPGKFRKQVGKALDKAREARNADKNLTNDMRSFNDALHDTKNHTPLPRVPTTYINTSAGDMAEAVKCNRALRGLMEAARAEHAPSWQGGQRTGILDVIRYKTRQPGDVEFFRNEADGGDMRLPNLSVSVILDGSGSMLHHVTQLGVAAYAIKTACDACDVPCTVTVFDVSAHLLWDSEDRPLDIPDAFCPLGGTDPTEALEVVDAQAHDKARHLVIVMTDGAWSGWQHKSLDSYSFPNRDMVVLFWNTNPTGIPGLKNVPHQRINSLMEIPQIVRRYLLQSM